MLRPQPIVLYLLTKVVNSPCHMYTVPLISGVARIRTDKETSIISSRDWQYFTYLEFKYVHVSRFS